MTNTAAATGAAIQRRFRRQRVRVGSGGSLKRRAGAERD
jgi:hypothetical protein